MFVMGTTHLSEALESIKLGSTFDVVIFTKRKWLLIFTFSQLKKDTKEIIFNASGCGTLVHLTADKHNNSKASEVLQVSDDTRPGEIHIALL